MPRFNAQRICFIRTSAIGDVVHGLAFLNGLRSGYPDAQITWITQRIPGELIAGHPVVDRVITFDRNMNPWGWRDLIRRIRNDRYDLLIDPQVSVKASLLTLCARADIKLGFDFHRTRELNWLVTTHRIPRNPPAHVLDQLLEFLDYLEIDYSEPVWDFRLTPEETVWKKRWQAQFSNPVISLVPSSSSPEKDWPAERYAVLADRIVSETDLEPVIICGPGKREIHAAGIIHSAAKSHPVIASEKPIRNTLCQLSCSRIVVAPDTGPLHMAVGLGIPTIGLYAFSNPNRCGPYRFRDLLVDLYNEPGNMSAPLTRKTRPGRMNLITVDMVMDKIHLALNTY
jgi:heptosyltransferase I